MLLWVTNLVLASKQVIHAGALAVVNAALAIRASILAFFRPRWRQWAAVVVAIPILFTLFAAGLTYALPFASGLWYEERARVYNDIAERAVGVALFDSGERFIGVVSRREEPDLVLSQREIALPGQVIYPDHKSLFVEDAPDAYWRCLVWLEDRRLRSALNPDGVDFVGLMQIPVSTATATMRSGRPRLGRGGSTLHMQLVRAMLKRFPGDRHINGLERRSREYLDAPVLSRRLRQDGGADPLRRWSAMHLPHIQGVREGSVYGVESASYIMFGRPAASLSPARQFLLAASVNQPIVLSRQPTNHWRRLTYGNEVNGQFRTGRARLCAENLLSGEQQTAAVEELRTLSESPPPIGLHPHLRGLIDLEGADNGRARAIASSPESLAQTLAGDAARGVVAELRDEYGPFWRRHVGRIRLTLDVPRNRAFRGRLSQTLTTLESSLGSSFNSRQFSLSLTEADRLNIVVAAADGRGRIVRFVDNQGMNTYFGLSSRRRREIADTLGRYLPELETRQVGSLSKLVAALALAQQGVDAPTSAYDNSCVLTARLHCYCGEGCGDAAQSHEANFVFGRSLNDALINRLRAPSNPVSDARLQRVLDSFSLATPQSHAQTPIATRVSIGFVAATPRAMQQVAAATLAAAMGDGQASAVLPTLVDRINVIDPASGHAQWEDAPRTRAGQALQVGASGSAFLREVLSQPVCMPNGTLSRLARWCPDGSTVVAHVAKTGTPSAPLREGAAFNEFDWWITGAIQLGDGRRYSYVVLIGTGNPGERFARNVGAGAAAPIVDILLDDLARRG